MPRQLFAWVILLVACSSPPQSSITRDRIGEAEDSGVVAAVPSSPTGVDGGADGPPLYQSGTRLKVRAFVGADGSRQFAGMRDATRDVDCTFAVAADGRTRCLPLATGASVGAYYADAACSLPLAATRAGCASLAPYALSVDVTVCPQRYRIRQVASQFSGDAVYTKSGGSCAAVSGPALVLLRADVDLYATGPELPAANFVEGTVEVQ